MHKEDSKEDKETKPTKRKNLQEELIQVPQMVKSEVNLITLPFFALRDNDVKERTETEYKVLVERDKQKLEIQWKVTSTPQYGYPGPFDREVHKAIEQIISELPTPIKNPIPIGSLYNICKRMKMKKIGGLQYKKIKEALERILATSIKSSGAFYSKEREEWIEDMFHLYDRVIFKGKKLPDGNIADTNYIYLNSWYLDNINANYVKPINWNYYKSLETPIAQRLYELLSVKFFGLLSKNGSFINYRYSTLCDVLPITRQKYLSRAHQMLDPAHERLIRTNFLEKAEWNEAPYFGEMKDWIIRYYPGKLAKEECKTLIMPIQLELDIHLSEIDPIEDGYSIIEQLVFRGISESVATKLLNDYPLERIQRQIEIFDWLKMKKSPLIAKNPAGFLRKAIEENYGLPADFLKEKKKKDMERKKKAEIDTEKEIDLRIQEYKSRLGEEERQKLRQEALDAINANKNIKKEFVNEILINAIESEIILKRLTN